MYPVYGKDGGSIQLQATLSSASAIGAKPPPKPHHPIVCMSELRYEEDGTFSCEHASVAPDDERTGYCVNHSIALLIMEIAREKL